MLITVMKNKYNSLFDVGSFSKKVVCCYMVKYSILYRVSHHVLDIYIKGSLAVTDILITIYIVIRY